MLELNKIYCCDCLDGMKALDNEIIDLTVTSPPYGNLRAYNGYIFDFESVARELYRITKRGGVVVWIIGDTTIKGSETGVSFKQALYFKEIGFRLHDTMIYRKVNYVPLNHNRYEQSFEYMFVFCKGKLKTFNPIRIKCINVGRIEKYGLKRRTSHGPRHSMRLYKKTTYLPTKETKIAPNIFSYTCGKKTGHPASFPEQLANDHIISWSNENDVILDPLIGGGTVAIEAIKTGRNFIGMDISQKYCDMANERILRGKERR